MRSNTQERAVDSTASTDTPDLDRYTSYEDGDAVVVCDRENPRAWIRSGTTATLES